jgi:hypothetical protein
MNQAWIDELLQDNYVQIYPNPAQSNTSIRIKNVSSEVMVYLYQSNGKRLNTPLVHFDNDCYLLPEIVDGIYFLHVVDNGIHQISKLVIHQ